MLEPLTMQPPPGPTRGARGFTLVELMATLAVLATVVTLAVPSFAGALARHRLKAAAEHLAQDLAEARFEATRRNRPLHLQFAPGAQWCYALATAGGCDCHVPQGCQLKTTRAADHPGVQLLQAEDGLVVPQPGAAMPAALLQGADGRQLRVSLNRMGRPGICAPGAAVSGYPAC